MKNKKILIVLLLSFIFLLFSCKKEEKLIFWETKDFEYIIGNEQPDYYSDLNVYAFDNTNLTNLVIIDDSSVDYNNEGSYNLIYKVNYLGNDYTKTNKVLVIKPDHTYYNVSFVTNIDEPMNDIIVKENSLLVLSNELTNNHMYLWGWYLEPDFITKWDFDNDLVENDMTLYAYWTSEVVDLNFYYINDTHGAVLESYENMGMAKIGNLIIDEKTNNPETTIFISGGDMLQGQLISNYNYGTTMIDILNDLSLDAYNIGNHEFDWGIDKVMSYFNGENDLQANFPFLGGNVYEYATGDLLEGLKPYTIIEKSNVKIAIIGMMGYRLEGSIAYDRIKDYHFIDPINETKYWSEYVKKHEGADIVVAVNHHDSDAYNNALKNLPRDRQIDAIFNGHSHQYYIRDYYNQNSNAHIIQSGRNGSNVGRITLTYSYKDGVIKSKAINLTQNNESRLRVENEQIKEKVNHYLSFVSDEYEELMVSKYKYDQTALTNYIAKLMQIYSNADVGIHNFGGTRAPIRAGESLTFAKLYEISPFDNKVVSVDIKGSVLKRLITNNSNDYYFRDNLSPSNINSNETYKVATNDYIYGNSYDLKNGTNYIDDNTLVLDLFHQTILNQKDIHDFWDTSLEIIFNNVVFSGKYYYFPKKEQFFI
ncbi:MAG: 5'-nucleotidase C-terminal domain-containing protein [Acholeplasmataceae bacterium]